MSASFSPDGSRIVIGGETGIGEGLGRERRVPRSSTLKGHSGRDHLGVVQPGRVADRDRERDGTAKVWDATTGAEVLTLMRAGQAPDRLGIRRRSARTGRGS